MLFISEAFAQAQGAVPAEPSAAANLIPLLLIFGIFYFLLIRPQHKKIKEHHEMVDSVKKGDEIVTGGGILGKVKKIEDDIVHVEVASGVEIRVKRNTIMEFVKKESKKNDVSDKEDKKDKKK